MAQNKLYQCAFNQHVNCDYSLPCLGCKEFAPDAMVNKNTSYNKQSTPCQHLRTNRDEFDRLECIDCCETLS